MQCLKKPPLPLWVPSCWSLYYISPTRARQSIFIFYNKNSTHQSVGTRAPIRLRVKTEASSTIMIFMFFLLRLPPKPTKEPVLAFCGWSFKLKKPSGEGLIFKRTSRCEHNNASFSWSPFFLFWWQLYVCWSAGLQRQLQRYKQLKRIQPLIFSYP